MSEQLLSNPLVSIVLPAYNRSDYIEQAIHSVIDQTYANWELVIADNGSNLETQKILEKYYELERVTHYRNEVNIGLFPNLNKAIAACSGQYVLLLCDDDFLLPECLETTVKNILKFPAADLLLSPIKRVDSQNNHLPSQAVYKFSIFAPETKLSYPENTLPLLLQHGSINSNLTGMLFKRDLSQKVGFFREDWKHAADWEWVYRVAKSCPILLNSVSIAVIRGHSGQQSKANFRDLSNSKEVAKMVKFLLSEPLVKVVKESDQWASHIMQHHLWYAFKALSSGNWNSFLTLIQEVHTTTGFLDTFWSMLLFLPERWQMYSKKDFPRY